MARKDPRDQNQAGSEARARCRGGGGGVGSAPGARGGCVRTAFRVVLGTVAIVTLAAGACRPLHEAVRPADSEFYPPELLAVRVQSPTELALDFDKPTSVVTDSVQLEPALAVTAPGDAQRTVLLEFAEPSEAGAQYALRAAVRDEAGNTLQFVISFYGFNDRLPELLINEFSPRGSASNPERVELFVQQGGNTAGVCLYNGVAGDYDSKIILPNREVETGEYLVVHFRPDSEPIGEERLNFQVPEAAGLPSNNGVLALYDTPNGTILDAVIYTNRTSQSDSTFRGFGTRRTLDRVDTVVAAGAWQIADRLAAPEDAVWADHASPTRSINRDSHSTDTDHLADWHTVPTRGATFGAVNSDERFVPD